MYWSRVTSQCYASFCCTSKSITYTHTYIPSFLDFLPIQVTMDLSTEQVPCAAQQVLISYLFYTWSQQCILIYLNQISQFIPFPHLVSISLFSTSVSLQFFFVNRFFCTNHGCNFYLCTPFLTNFLNSTCISDLSLSKPVTLSESNDTLRPCSFRKHQAQNLQPQDIFVTRGHLRCLNPGVTLVFDQRLSELFLH